MRFRVRNGESANRALKTRWRLCKRFLRTSDGWSATASGRLRAGNGRFTHFEGAKSDAVMGHSGTRMDAFTELGIIVGISVAAHVSIAWTAIAYHTRRAEKKWSKKVEEEMIPRAAQIASDRMKADLPPLLDEKLASLDPGAEIEGFLRSPAGVSWAQEVATLAATTSVAKLKEVVTSEVGATTRAGQSAAEKMVNGIVDFQNPYVNFLWMNLPPDLKRRVAGTLYRAMGRTMAGAVGEENGGQAFLPEPHGESVGSNLL